MAELFSWVPLLYCSPPGCRFLIKSPALSAHVSPQTIHFRVLDKSPVSGPGGGSPSCSSLVAKLCLTLCDPMDCSMPDFPVLHHLPEFAQTHVLWISDAIQPSCHLSPLAFNLSQYHSLFQWVSSLHQVAQVLKFQHESFQWIFRVDFL